VKNTNLSLLVLRGGNILSSHFGSENLYNFLSQHIPPVTKLPIAKYNKISKNIPNTVFII
jgi:hypothetical protein